jgi:hypothetical protein
MNGHLMGLAQGQYPYTADLLGTLDCNTLKLEMGQIQNGKVTVTTLTFPFAGPIAADYDPISTSFINGTWNVKQTNGPSTGMGTWSAAHK